MENPDDDNHQVDGDGTTEDRQIDAVLDDFNSRSAVNSLILDYYKKFGRKRDLEQFFSLSTAQSDIRDTSGLFWRRMKSENDSSDGERKSDSSREVCRISIRCAVAESSSQEDDPKTKSDSPHTTSPPIIIEELGADNTQHSDDEFNKSDDNHSQKSLDALLDISSHKPLSPTSSITSQRKLEWDSLADVGYGNESDRKTSASSLSTLERLALKQQYSNNDSKSPIGLPASQSTPVDEKERQSKTKKGVGKKTKIYQKGVDIVEFNVPNSSESNPTPSINVNLTKHISFNVDKDGGINIDSVKKESVSPEKVFNEKAVAPYFGMDKESQTSLNKASTSTVPIQSSQSVPLYSQKIPVMISLNTLRKRLRKKRSRVIRKKVKTKKQADANAPHEKSGEQLSAAESFEYLPGHIYNQNQLKVNQTKGGNSTGNKSSLESSGACTTDSSKGSKHSLTKDLEKCIDVLKVTLQKRGDDAALKKKLIKEIVYKLLNSKYRDDDSGADFLSGLSFSSKKLGLGNNTTSSTSDANNTDESHQKTPRKSILRVDKFNPNIVSSTSQSVPNLPTATSNEKFTTNLTKAINSNTESDGSSKGKTSSDNALPKTSSEELYLKYLEALRREEAYKRHLKDKEQFLKTKLVSSDTVFKAPERRDSNVNRRLNELIKDLTRNNYDDGSGDASKLEGSLSFVDNSRLSRRNERSQSVFTLSSSNSERPKRPNLKKKMHSEREAEEPGSSRQHYCCCPHHFTPTTKVNYTDSSVQVNFRCFEDLESNSKSKTNILAHSCSRSKSPKTTSCCSDDARVEKNHACYCKTKFLTDTEDFKVHKTSKFQECGVQLDCPSHTDNRGVQCCSEFGRDGIQIIQSPHSLGDETTSSGKTSNARKRTSKSSQANLLIKMMSDGVYQEDMSSGSFGCCQANAKRVTETDKLKKIREATRCLQTEISINPRIREPTLSDIKIISQCDCVKLIDEQTRYINKSDTLSAGVKKTYSNACTNSMTGKLLLPSEDNIFDNKTYDINDNTNEQTNSKSVIEDYTIPIKGTDMALRVRLGRNKNDNQAPGKRTLGCDKQVNDIQNKRGGDQINDFSCNACVPDTYPTDVPPLGSLNDGDDTDQSPCCSTNRNTNKKVTKCTEAKEKNLTQSYSPIISPVQTSRRETSPRPRSPKTKSPKQQLNKQPINKYLRSGSPDKLPNTYPKTVIKEKTPFRRANTDSEVLTSAETDSSVKNNNYSSKGCGSCQQNNQTAPAKLESNEHTENKSSEPHASSRFEDDDKESGQKNPDTSSSSPKKVTKCTGCNTEPSEKQEVSKATENPPEETSKSIGCNTEKNNDSNLENTLRSGPEINEKTKKPTTSSKCVGCSSVGDSENKPKTEPKQTHDEKPPAATSKCVGCSTDPTISVVDEDKKPEPNPKVTNKGCGNKCSDKDNAKNDDISEKTTTNSHSLHSLTTKCSSNTRQKSNKYSCQTNDNQDPIIDMIQNITRKYSKNEIGKIKKKKCFKEIVTVLTYLLETDDSTDLEPKTSGNTTEAELCGCQSSTTNVDKLEPSSGVKCHEDGNKVEYIDKGVQLSFKSRRSSKIITESSDLPISTDLPATSSDSAACKVLHKIKKECEKFHQKRCKTDRKCERSSSTSVNCEGCRKVHYCPCRNHKCKRKACLDKIQKKCVAYNLIIQNSETVMSEENVCEKGRPLKNVVVKVPRCKDNFRKEISTKETVYKAESHNKSSPKCGRNRSRSCPNENEMSSMDEMLRTQYCTVREYLEKNRPDFVEKCSQRQHCLKYINECRANERASHRKLVSMHVERQPDLTMLTSDELRHLARQIGLDLRRKKPAPKFISEREMKKHSEQIYKTLPEVVRKKEEQRKENIKKTNLLMANIFKKNLQKKALGGTVSMSNYSPVIKI